MNDYQIIKEALNIAKAAHLNQTDKNGTDYIFHPITVALLCKDTTTKAIALLHDTLEDNDSVTYEMLYEKMGKEIADAVKILTYDSNNGSYLEYIQAIKDSGNKLAIEVKKADLTTNMDLSRIEHPTKKDYERIEKKYKPALLIINETN